MKQIRSLLAALLLLPAALAQDFTVVHFNDVYEIEPIDDGARGGAARVATLIDRIAREAGSEPLVLFSGDLLSPSIMSAVFFGEQMIDVMNRLGLDYAVYGNHEFDFGLEVAEQRVAESAFTWLSTNLLDSRSGQPLAGAHSLALADWNGVRVGLLGLINDWRELTSAGSDAEYVDFLAIAPEAVRVLQQEGAQVIIALTHMDTADDRLLAQNVPGIDLILGGHDHEPRNEVVNGTLVWKTGSDWRTLGELSVYALGSTKALVLPRTLQVDSSVPEDPAMASLVAQYTDALDEELGMPIGRTDVELDATREAVRSRETNMGNLIADAQRAFAGADAAIMNGGSIRTDRTYGPGELTRHDVIAVLPFGNIVISVQASGAQLREALENGVSEVEHGAGRFPQVSGIRFSYDPSLPAGQRVLSVEVAGEPLDEDRIYLLSINDYIGSGGDGYTVFEDLPRVMTEESGLYLADVVADYIAEQGSVAPRVEGRITAR